LVHFVGLGVVIRQRRVIGGGQRTGLDLMAQLQQVLAANAHLAGELRGGDSLGDAAENQEDLGRTEVCALPRCSREHIEHAPAPLAAVVDDRRVGVPTVDVEPLAGATTGASQPLGMEQVEELLTATLLVHQVDDWEVHGSGSGRFVIDNQKWIEEQGRTWR
jgi:hypothetical protein